MSGKFETVKKVIDGKEYAVVRFPFSQGIAIQSRIIKTFGPVILLDKESDTGEAVSKFVEMLGVDGGFGLVVDILKRTYCNGKVLNERAIDDEYAGEYLHLYKVVLFVIEVNRYIGDVNILEKLNSLKKKSAEILTEKSVAN